MIGQRPTDAVISTAVAMNMKSFVGIWLSSAHERRTDERRELRRAAERNERERGVDGKGAAPGAKADDHRNNGRHHNQYRQDCTHDTETAVQVRALRRYQRRLHDQQHEPRRHEQAVHVDDCW